MDFEKRNYIGNNLKLNPIIESSEDREFLEFWPVRHSDRLRDEGHKDYYLNVTESLHHWKLIFIICYMAFIILTVLVCIGLRSYVRRPGKNRCKLCLWYNCSIYCPDNIAWALDDEITTAQEVMERGRLRSEQLRIRAW